MHIFNRTTLTHFSDKYPDCKSQFNIWYKNIEKGDWKNLNEIKDVFQKSSILNDLRMVFRIKSYRLIVEFNLLYQRGFIKWIGTHDEYNRIDANTVSLF